MEENIKANLIKDALNIIDELAKSKLDFDDVDINLDYENLDKLEMLIKRAKQLKKNKLWKLN